MKRRVDLIMFDLDGTLADTGPDLADSVNFTRAKFDLAPLEARRIYGNVGRGAEHLIRQCLPVTTPEHFRQAMRVFAEHYKAHLLDKTTLYPGVLEVLDEYRDKRRIVVSNKVQRFSQAVVHGLGIGDCFDLVLGGDCAEKKPHPALLKMALERFQTRASRALMVGDGDIDIEEGKYAGVMTCGVTAGLGDRNRLIAAKPDVLVERLTEMRKYFF
jgi:phosphoglycolate phosphatase